MEYEKESPEETPPEEGQPGEDPRERFRRLTSDSPEEEDKLSPPEPQPGDTLDWRGPGSDQVSQAKDSPDQTAGWHGRGPQGDFFNQICGGQHHATGGRPRFADPWRIRDDR